MSNAEDQNNNQEKSTEWEVIQVTGDLRKFSNYVLVPNHKTGKDKIFINLLGFRPTGRRGCTITFINLY
ncbi:MAG: hypothetical protein KME29_33495 [Calothrix sp. FI2-JRJ7]|jgi:hypothetical protein|nr:hypothetical protein [Calothrix sp. FI2-JRJ7]